MSYENIPKNEAGTAALSQLIPSIKDMLDLPFLQEKVVGLTLAANTVIGSFTITLTSGHGLTTANSGGHILEIAHTTDGRFYQGRIVDVTGNVVTLGTAMSAVFVPASSVLSTGNSNLVADSATGTAIDGSTTPVIFSIAPLPTQQGVITKLVLVFTSDNDSDMLDFGGAASLARGMTLRLKRNDGSYKNIFTYRSNLELGLHAFDTEVLVPKSGNSVKGLLYRISFGSLESHGASIALRGELNERLELVVNDLMVAGASGNFSLTVLAQGSEL